jgi:signal transduction histidine kinase
MDQPTVAQLQALEELQHLPAAALQWIIDHSVEIHLPQGEHLFKPGQAIHHLYILLDGHIQLKIQQGNQLIEAGRWEAGTISGMLPYSRMEAATGFGLAVADTHLLALHEDLFPEMEQVSRELVKAFVGVMTNRTRSFIRLQQRNEKMMALGKLSAGLAHELNNPAAAIVRSSRALKSHLSTTPENFKQVITMQLSPEQVDEVNDIVFSRIKQPPPKKLSMMESNGIEDEIADWLEDQGIDDGYDVAENFAEFGLHLGDVERIGKILQGQHLGPVFRWLNSVLITERVVSEIQEASSRISELVTSVKTYTHMDRSPDRVATDIHEGINSTLTLLHHKVKAKNIEVAKHYEESLPTIPLFVSEMNQVWTNLIDNAIDAMDQGGTLTIRTRTDNDHLGVDVEDTGTGIPPDIQASVFDPFFTTKAVGQGTGLGLDIARKIVEQHDGTISLESEPGHTRFTLCFPLAP